MQYLIYGFALFVWFVLNILDILQDRFEAWADREPPNRENLPRRISAFEVNSVFQAPNEIGKLQEAVMLCTGGGVAPGE